MTLSTGSTAYPEIWCAASMFAEETMKPPLSLQTTYETTDGRTPHGRTTSLHCSATETSWRRNIQTLYREL